MNDVWHAGRAGPSALGRTAPAFRSGQDPLTVARYRWLSHHMNAPVRTPRPGQRLDLPPDRSVHAIAPATIRTRRDAGTPTTPSGSDLHALHHRYRLPLRHRQPRLAPIYPGCCATLKITTGTAFGMPTKIPANRAAGSGRCRPSSARRRERPVVCTPQRSSRTPRRRSSDRHHLRITKVRVPTSATAQSHSP
jgi:hypothetical protein